MENEQDSGQQDMAQFQQMMEYERKKKMILRKVLDGDARARLGNIRSANQQYAAQIEQLLINYYLSGKLAKTLSDAEFKNFLTTIRDMKNMR